jgi:L-lactate dehydrogenase complex protein LldG
MNAREQILGAIRKQTPPTAELPALDANWIQYTDARQQFIDSLASVGGNAFVVESTEQIDSQLEQLEFYELGAKVCSLVADVGHANVVLHEIADPHELEDLDVAIMPGEFAVAENAAVWVTDRGVKHRVIYFLAQHLVLVVPANEIVHNMHEAYERLEFGGPGFGTFISGPSKTADIEQSLVIGAHGARSLTVFLIGPP